MRAIRVVLLVVAAAAIAFATGFALLVFNHSRALNFWLLIFPIVATIVALALLRRASALRRSAVAGVALLFVVMVVGFGVDRFEDVQSWEEAPDTRAVADVVPGFALRPDGKGPYMDANDRAKVYIHHLLTIELPRGKNVPRPLQVDLSRPVPGSGAIALGTVPSVIWLKTYWYQDSNRVIRAVASIQKDTIVVSDRTDILLRIDGRMHRLTLGSWTGHYADAEPGVGGAGTTPVTIARSAQDTFEVVAAPGSIARLWDVQSSEGPLGPRAAVDKGLYYVDFSVVYRPR